MPRLRNSLANSLSLSNTIIDEDQPAPTLFETVLFRGNVFKLQATESTVVGKTVFLTLNPSTLYPDLQIIAVSYNLMDHSAYVQHFFYPPQNEAEMAKLFDAVVSGPDRNMDSFVLDVMIILKLVAIFLKCTMIELFDSSVFPKNDYMLALNAYKSPPFASYYSKHHAFFSKSCLNGINRTDLYAVATNANAMLENNASVAAENTYETVEEIVTRFYEYKRTGIPPPPTDPTQPGFIPGGLHRNLATVFNDRSWLEFDNIHEEFRVVPIPFTWSIQGNQFVIVG